MTRGPDFICFKDFAASVFPRLYFPTHCSIGYATLLLLMLFSASPAFTEETKVFTDADLVNYKAEPMVDQETQSRMEEDLKSYEKKKDAEFHLEREKRKRKQAEEAKRPALQKKKQDITVSGAPVSNQSRGTSGNGDISHPASKKKT
jgi:hypothetical protein